MTPYDVVIIGGGAGAFAAAIKANDLGAKTALINHGLPLGGTCVNVGCVPSKTLLHAAELLHSAQHHNVPGITLTATAADYAAVVTDEIALVEQLRTEKYEQVLANLDNVTFIPGIATFTSARTVRVGEQDIEGYKFIIATGSTAIVPAIEGLTQADYLTHVEAMQFKSIPARLAVIGAGPVGLEMAQLYARFGSEVTIMQRADRILPGAEPELTGHLRQLLEAEGITVKTGVHVTKVMLQNGIKNLVYTDANGEHHLQVEKILLAVGKTPNTNELKPATANIHIDNQEAIITDQTLRTSQPHIFAVGDVTNLPLRLETTAGREGTYAVLNALSGSDKSINYSAVPYTIFTDPQIASVGYTEEQQMKELKTCACRTLTFDNVPKALITKRTEGIIKMTVHPETRVITGVHILAPNASDLIAQAMGLINNKNTIDDIVEMLPVFPTMSEAIKLAAMSFPRDVSKLSCCI
jgi:mercuric reductase